MMIVADSVGFSGTHSISAILSGINGAYVSHGSQNFRERTPIGVNNQSPKMFLDGMCATSKEHRHTVAIHTTYHPEVFSALCRERGIAYKLIVRNPYQQIKSCYHWAMKKFYEKKDVYLLERMHQLMTQLQHVIAPTLSNGLYLFAFNHVARFNIAALSTGVPIIPMERLLRSESYFKSTFHLPHTVRMPHFNGSPVHKMRHSQRAEQFYLPEPDIEHIHNVTLFNTPNGPLNFYAYLEKMGYEEETPFLPMRIPAFVESLQAV